MPISLLNIIQYTILLVLGSTSSTFCHCISILSLTHTTLAVTTRLISMAVTVTGGMGKKGKPNRNKKVLCVCGCNRRLTSAQHTRHMKLLASKFITENSAYRYRRAADLAYIWTGCAQGKYRHFEAINRSCHLF